MKPAWLIEEEARLDLERARLEREIKAARNLAWLLGALCWSWAMSYLWFGIGDPMLFVVAVAGFFFLRGLPVRPEACLGDGVGAPEKGLIWWLLLSNSYQD